MEGDLLIRRLLGSQLQALYQTQRDNIFHTRCYINENLCYLIVDSGSCTNAASSKLVSKLNLETKPYPRPYKLQWLYLRWRVDRKLASGSVPFRGTIY